MTNPPLWQAEYDNAGISLDIELPDANTSVLDVLEDSFSTYATRPVYTFMGKTMTYKELDLYSRQIAAYLQSLDLEPLDKVAVMTPNILQFPIIALGIIRAGYTLVNVNPLYTSRELEHQLHDSGAKALFIVENFAKTYQDVDDKGDLKHVVVCSIGDMLGMVKGLLVNTVVRHVKKMVPKYSIQGHVKFKDALTKVSASRYQRPTLKLDDTMILQYTGGTTGVAKGAELTHGNVIANMLQIKEFMRPALPEDFEQLRILAALPLYHIFSFQVCLMLSLECGWHNILIANPRDLDNLVKDIDDFKPHILPAVNTLFNGLNHHEGFKQLDFDFLEMAIGGGMAVLPSVAKEFKQITGVNIAQGYGLSETSPVATLNPLTLDDFTNSIGIPLPSTDVILVDDDGKEVAQGERGEIAIKGPQVMKGYWMRPDETKKTFTEAGYFKTGDIGVIDDKGYFKIVDRKKDMILVSGFNVYPNEIEEALSEHTDIVEVGAIGIPDDNSGEVPKVFVVKKAGATLTKDDVIAYAKENLTGYKRPKQVEFIDELPKSNVGKILRKELRNRQSS